MAEITSNECPKNSTGSTANTNEHQYRMIELIDDEANSEEFKKGVALPYFKDIYKDLMLQSDDKK